MDLISKQLQEVQTQSKNLQNGHLISCNRNLIQFQVHFSPILKLNVNIQFPLGYPEKRLIVDVTSKTMSPDLTSTVRKFAEKVVDDSKDTFIPVGMGLTHMKVKKVFGARFG